MVLLQTKRVKSYILNQHEISIYNIYIYILFGKKEIKNCPKSGIHIGITSIIYRNYKNLRSGENVRKIGTVKRLHGNYLSF